jgi:diguanylate cyclase (GGDEF)-like protein
MFFNDKHMGLPVKNLIAIFIVALSGMFPAVRLSAQTDAGPVITLNGDANWRMGKHLYLLIDESKERSIHWVADRRQDGLFKPSNTEIPNLGIIKAAAWARFTIHNPQNISVERYLSFEYPLAGRVSLYIPGKTGFRRIDAGCAVKTVHGLIPGRYYVFPMTFEAGETKTFYMRVVSAVNMVLPMTLWTPEALHGQDRKEQMLFGVIFGVLFASVFYFTALGIKLKSKAIKWFALYIVCLGLLLSIYHGYLQALFKPFFPYLNRVLLISIIGCLYFSGAKFYRIFLNTSSYSPRTDRIMQALQWMGLGFIPMNLFGNPLTPLYGIILVGIGPFYSSAASLYLWRKGVPNAKYLVIGWLVAHATSVIDLLRAMNLIPWTAGSIYLIPSGMIFAVIFFSIAILEQTRIYRERSHRDGLTGLYNRRGFDETLATEWNRHLRERRSLSVLLVDVDNLKEVNDRHGHSRGDSALKAVGEILSRNMKRAGDRAARYGGDEFAAILPETDAAHALLLAEKIRGDVESIPVKSKTSKTEKTVTVSIGVGTVIPDNETIMGDLVDRADRSLYRAKAAGRNRVISDYSR